MSLSDLKDVIAQDNRCLSLTIAPHLPPEIISTIMLRARHKRFLRVDNLEQPLLPIALKQVCRYWRDMVESLPELWLDIVLDAMSLDRPTVQAFLSLSQPHPLSVIFAAPDDLRGAFVDRVIMKNLLDHCDRWRDVTFDDYPMRQASQAHFSLLETLHIRIDTIRYDPYNMYFQNAPRLKHIILITADVPTLPALPWTQFQSIRIVSYPACECMAAAVKAKGATDLHFEAMKPHEFVADPAPSLRTLPLTNSLRMSSAPIEQADGNDSEIVYAMEGMTLP